MHDCGGYFPYHVVGSHSRVSNIYENEHILTENEQRTNKIRTPAKRTGTDKPEEPDKPRIRMSTNVFKRPGPSANILHQQEVGHFQTAVWIQTHGGYLDIG